jgi:hypothetical protein
MAQVQPAPGWCSTAHCNNQMNDFVPQPPLGLSGSVYVKTRDTARSGVALGLACVSNGTNFACAYKDSPHALVYYDAEGNVLWTSGDLLNAHIDFSAPIIQTDGSVVIGDDQHIYKFNSDGTVAWSTPTPGGQPISLVTTPNGAIFSATAQVAANPCLQNNCQLAVTVNNGGRGYTSATVSFSGGNCPDAAATATVSGGRVSAITVSTQGRVCIIPPDVIITGDGSGALASAQLNTPTPLSVYSGFTGALVGSKYLYSSGTSGAYYQTINTPCVNNGTYPKRVYVSTSLVSDKTQGGLWALDIDPTNFVSPIKPAWALVFGGPSGASPLCVGDRIYFDGASYKPGDDAGTTIFGVQDNGTSGTMLFHVSLGPSKGPVSSNFALDPRAAGGFWHQLMKDPAIYHRDGATGSLIESIHVSNLLTGIGAPPATYWTAGIFTTYGTPERPYLMMSEYARDIASYYAMVDLTTRQLVWALPIYPGNSPFPADSAEGAAAMAISAGGQPVVAIASRFNGAYFIAEGPGTLALSSTGLSFGSTAVGAISAAQTVTLTNTASVPLIAGGISAGGDFAQTNTCTAPLAPGAGCTITVTFSPTAAGSRSGAVTITDNAAGSPHTVALYGEGSTDVAAIGLSSNLLNFPDQVAGTTSPPQAMTLINTGAAPLTIAGIAASGDAVQSNGCPTSLAAGASCLINVMFAAAGIGPRSGTVTITGNAPNSPQVITLTGAGVAAQGAAAGLSSTSLVFRAQSLGGTGTPQTVTLVNAGTTPLNIAGISAAGDASQTNTCNSTLLPGANCTITIRFVPSAIGLRTATITISDDAPDSPQAVAVSGVGLGNPVPLLNLPLRPANRVPGASQFTLTVNGAGFIPSSVVNWNGAALATSFTSSKGLSATVPASALTAAGTASVTVTNPGPGGGISNPAWFPVTTSSASLEFSRTDLPAGAGPQGLAVTDFDGDFKLDVVVANSGANTVSLLRGNGDGTFAPKVDAAAGSQPVAVAAGDVNGDGKPDLVTANQAANTVSVLLGNGNGTFAPKTDYPAGAGPAAIAVVDWNGDGNLDLAVANRSGNTISILLGQGNGTFAARMDYTAGQSPSALAAGDFNGDGKPDLAVANAVTPGGTISVLLGNGDGSFQPPASYATGDSVGLAAADVNGDGKLDLVAVNQVARTLSVLLGNGSGAFSAVTTPVVCTSMCFLDPGAEGFTMAPLSGDGMLAIALANRDSGTVSILQSNGNGKFQAPIKYAAAPGPVAVVAADFNGDGSLDLAAAASGAGTVSILLQSPVVMLSSGDIDFGNVVTGSSVSRAVTLANSGSAVLKLAGIAAGGAFSQTNDCPASLPGGEACTVTVTFAPPTSGQHLGQLTVTPDFPGSSPATGDLTGMGVAVNVALNLTQTTVTGGNTTSSNSVSLSSPAPPGGAVVSLSSSDPVVASPPPSVTIAEGATVSPGFSIATTGVASGTPVTISAAYDGVVSGAILTVYAASLASVSLSPASVTSGLSTTSNVVNLNGQAPPAGGVVKLYSSNPAVASVPATVTVPAYSRSSNAFTITAGLVSVATPVVISAMYGRVTVTATLTVNPVAAASVTLSPNVVVGGRVTAATNLVTLNAPAPPGGASVTLSSSNSAVASVPASVAVAAGATVSDNFPITTVAVAARTIVTISATCGGVTQTATLTVNPATPFSVMLSQTNVTGGTAVTGNRVLLNGPAPPAGATISLSSSNPAVAAVPATVAAGAGATYSQAFTITTTAASSATNVTISASYLGVAKSATLTVSP